MPGPGAESALGRISGTVEFSCQMGAALGVKIQGKAEPLPKEFHPENFDPLAPGIEGIGGEGGIVKGVLGGEESFKDPGLVLFFNADTEIFDLEDELGFLI